MTQAGAQPAWEPGGTGTVEIRWTRGFRVRNVQAAALLGIVSVLTLTAGVGIWLTMPGAAGWFLVVCGLGGLAVVGMGVAWAVREWNGAALVLDDRALEMRVTIRGRARPWRIEWDDIGRVLWMRPQVLWQRWPPTVVIVAKDPLVFLRRRTLLGRVQSRLSWRMMGVRWATLLVDGFYEADLAELGARIAQAAGLEMEVRE